MYSSVPVLSDVLFYTPTDSYNYMTDNRPIYQLDSNIRSVATSLVGVGYGEHASVSGSALSPGKGVELLTNGLIKYPDSTTNVGNDTPAILGLVIGVTSAGLSRVIWSASLLDLDILGLAGILGNGSTPGQYLVISNNSLGNISLLSSVAPTDLTLGVIRRDTFISVGQQSLPSISTDPTSEINALNNYGVTRKRNLYLLQSMDATPIQYNKSIVYASSFSMVNPLSIVYTPSVGQISADLTLDPIYGTDSSNWKLREVYTQFANTDTTDSVAYINGSGTTSSTWSSIAYSTSFVNGIENYELQPIPTSSGVDFSQSTNLHTFKNFEIVKYYQYARVSAGNPAYGKVTAIVTIFDPTFNGNSCLGGETSKTMICDFFGYDTAGREISKNRIVMNGSAAQNLYSDSAIFRNGINSNV